MEGPREGLGADERQLWAGTVGDGDVPGSGTYGA